MMNHYITITSPLSCLLVTFRNIFCSVFNHLLDDGPLPANEASSSVLVAMFSQISPQQGKDVIGEGKPALNCEIEKGFLMLVSSDSPALQVHILKCGRWHDSNTCIVSQYDFSLLSLSLFWRSVIPIYFELTGSKLIVIGLKYSSWSNLHEFVSSTIGLWP